MVVTTVGEGGDVGAVGDGVAVVVEDGVVVVGRGSEVADVVVEIGA